MCERTLSTVCFRHVPGGDVDVDAHNDALATAIREDGRVYLASAVVDGSDLPARVLRELPDPPGGRRLHRRRRERAGPGAQAGVSRIGIRLMPLKKFD